MFVLSSIHFTSLHHPLSFPLLLLCPAEMAGITDLVLSKRKKHGSNALNFTPAKEVSKLIMADPNGPLIYDMMVNRSSGWRAKNLRPSILPPGWKMGISRLGRVPVYDPLYETNPPQRVLEHPEPTAVISGHGVAAGVPPRYQATGPQFDFAIDDYNLGLPPRLAQLYHENIRRRGGGVAIGGRLPFIPSGMSGRGRVPIIVDDLLDEDSLYDGSVDPRIDILQRPSLRRGVHFPPDGIHHRPGHGHLERHRPGHGHSHEVVRPDHLERDIRISNHAQQMDRRNAELKREVDLEAAVIAQQQQDLQVADQRRREEHIRLHEERLARQAEHARLEEEEIRRRQAEEELVRREEELQVTEAELIAEEIQHREHHERQRHRQERGHRDTRRVVRDRDGRAVLLEDHPPQHRELIRVPAHDPHHPHLGHQHNSPPRHHPSVARAARQARHVHFADALDSSEEERIVHHRERLRQEAYPLPRRRRFDRERSPYHLLEGDLGKFARDEFYDSADEYYLHHERLLMPPQHRRARGDWWEDAELGSGDDE